MLRYALTVRLASCNVVDMPSGNKTLLADGFVFPEGPRWHDERLWIADQHAHQVVAIDLSGQKEVVARFDDMPSGLGWLPDGSLLVAAMRNQEVLRVLDGTTLVHANLRNIGEGHVNDMVVGGDGRAYIGHRRGKYATPPDRNEEWLVLVEPDGGYRVVADDVVAPNGSVITPDGRKLIVAESRAKRLSGWHIQDDGSLSERWTFAELDGGPDGICLDAEGAIWAALPSASKFVRVRDGGEVVDTVEVDSGRPIACALGGVGRKTLFMVVTQFSIDRLRQLNSASDDASSDSRGRVETIDVAVPGAGWP